LKEVEEVKDCDGEAYSTGLKEKEVMLRSGEVNVASEVIEEFRAVLGEPGEHAENSLL
jgi:hypothetical protein